MIVNLHWLPVYFGNDFQNLTLYNAVPSYISFEFYVSYCFLIEHWCNPVWGSQAASMQLKLWLLFVSHCINHVIFVVCYWVTAKNQQLHPFFQKQDEWVTQCLCCFGVESDSRNSENPLFCCIENLANWEDDVQCKWKIPLQPERVYGW